MRAKLGLLVVPAAWIPGMALAGAWPQAPGATQVITSCEPGSASRAFDSDGQRSRLSYGWKQSDVSVFIDHGVSQHFTFSAKIDLQDYRNGSMRFSGLGSVEAGGRWTVHKGRSFVFALGASVEGLGKGRRSDFDTVTKAGTDYDLRAYAGKSFRIAGVDVFVDLQAARHLRQYEADQWRVDATLGLKPSPRWMVLAQAFAGRTDRQAWGQATWVNSEVSLVRSFGPKQNLSLQVGFRQTTAGRNVPAVHAIIIGLWRTF